jgi:hypothetical protein
MATMNASKAVRGATADSAVSSFRLHLPGSRAQWHMLESGDYLKVLPANGIRPESAFPARFFDVNPCCVRSGIRARIACMGVHHGGHDPAGNWL